MHLKPSRLLRRQKRVREQAASHFPREHDTSDVHDEWSMTLSTVCRHIMTIRDYQGVFLVRFFLHFSWVYEKQQTKQNEKKRDASIYWLMWTNSDRSSFQGIYVKRVNIGSHSGHPWRFFYKFILYKTFSSFLLRLTFSSNQYHLWKHVTFVLCLIWKRLTQMIKFARHVQ